MPEREIDDGYPIVVRLAGRRVVVVGGGEVALRKTLGFVRSGAQVTVISPEVVPALEDLEDLEDVEGVTIVRRRYESADVEGAWLIVAATNDPAVQQQIFDDGERAHVFVNAVDDPERCSFILPAVVRRGPVIVAVSTQGRSPSLAGQLRDRLAGALPDDLESIVAAAAQRRREIHERGGSTEDEAWDGLLG
ncbi:MAG: bifunctional precorrin-2 dehydrogenase/sirohydrochlorin ferrochelatase [Actinobacteria bacterium]|nr:bifunctional precorrin-2 dehydrogenase/sirohydrochlorin ferrochelatase [Actinomycetota bacterium]